MKINLMWEVDITYILLLLMDVANLEPDVLLSERVRRRVYDVLEALQTRAVLLLLLVNYAEPEVYFVRLLEVGLHLHDLGECLFGVLQRPVAVIQDANAIPELRFLREC